jgi:hypothetical protein
MSRSQYQDGLTISVAIRPGMVEQLRSSLADIESDVESNSLIPFLQCETLHFARFVVLDEAADVNGRVVPACLIFSTNFDEPQEDHLQELVAVGLEGLNHVFQYCEGYPDEGSRSRDAIVSFLKRHDIGYDTLYVGTRGRTVREIRREAILRNRIQEYLDGITWATGLQSARPQEVRLQIQEFVRSQPDLRWSVSEEAPRVRARWPRRRDVMSLILTLGVIVGIGIAGALVASALGTYWWIGVILAFVLAAAGVAITLRLKEKRDIQYPPDTDFDHVRKLAVKEDRIVQNQMSSVTNIKAGSFRTLILKTVLRVIDLAGRYVFTRGHLGSIPSIHFARWVVIDNGRRLLFFSNFDGSWENYLGDFIDKAATGLTAVWSNTHGYPRTRWLIYDGATDEQRFKAYARNSQILTDVWYSAYKTLSVQNVNNNSAIRRGLFGEQTEEETARWLQRL